MKQKVLCVLLMLSMGLTTMAQSDSERDGVVVAQLSKAGDSDWRCEVYPKPVKTETVNALMQSGRYVESITCTKFGMLIVHHPNTEGISQRCEELQYLPVDGPKKKRCKQLMKQGWNIVYHEGNEGFTIFDKTGNGTLQSFGYASKQLKSHKGYGLMVATYSMLLQNNRTDIALQKAIDFQEEDLLLNGINAEMEQGWTVGSVAAKYDNYFKHMRYSVCFNKMATPQSESEVLITFDSQDELLEKLAPYAAEGYRISKTWGGWSASDYANRVRKEQQALDMAQGGGSSSSTSDGGNNIWDVLQGLTSSLAQLSGKGGSVTAPAVNTATVGTTATAATTKSATAAKPQNKCKRCHGTGKCSMRGNDKESYCGGSGKCRHCGGSGKVYASGIQIDCSYCSGSKKCRSCDGTGKCLDCDGTGIEGAVTKTTVQNHTITGSCSLCLGTGRCTSDNKFDRKKGCSGSGHCQYCSGSGTVGPASSPAQCGICHGTGKCQMCKGNGKCIRCHGKGKL